MRANQYENDEKLLQKIEEISPSKQTACYQITLEEIMLQEARTLGGELSFIMNWFLMNKMSME